MGLLATPASTSMASNDNKDLSRHLWQYTKFRLSNPLLSDEEAIERFTKTAADGTSVPGQNVESMLSRQVETAPSMQRTGSAPDYSEAPQPQSYQMARTQSLPQAPQWSSREITQSFHRSSGSARLPIQQQLPFTASSPAALRMSGKGTDSDLTTETPMVAEFSSGFAQAEPYSQQIPLSYDFITEASSHQQLSSYTTEHYSLPSTEHQALTDTINPALFNAGASFEGEFTTDTFSEPSGLTSDASSFQLDPCNSFCSASSMDQSMTFSPMSELHRATPMSREASGTSQLLEPVNMLRVHSDDGGAALTFPTQDKCAKNGSEVGGGFETHRSRTRSSSLAHKRPSALSVSQLQDAQIAEEKETAPHTNHTRRQSKSPKIEDEGNSGENAKHSPTKARPHEQQALPRITRAPHQPVLAPAIKPLEQRQQQQQQEQQANTVRSVRRKSNHIYVRPQHPRVYCKFCPENKDGFRGDHELRRHEDRMHATTRKMWVVKDMSQDGKLLAKCKACSSGRRYGIDYNATAHLRRQHFNKEKNPKIQVPANLRDWIEEVMVKAEEGQKRKGRVRKGAASTSRAGVKREVVIKQDETRRKKAEVELEEEYDGTEEENQTEKETHQEQSDNEDSADDSDMSDDTDDPVQDQKLTGMHKQSIANTRGFTDLGREGEYQRNIPFDAPMQVASLHQQHLNKLYPSWEAVADCKDFDASIQYSATSGEFPVSGDFFDEQSFMVQDNCLPPYLGRSEDGNDLSLERYMTYQWEMLGGIR